MTDADESSRYVLTACLMFGDITDAQAAAQRIEAAAGDALAVECFIEEMTPK